VLDWVQLIVRRYTSVEVDDIAQETLARVFALARQVRSEPIANPAAYITRIAQHLAVDAVRRQGTLTPDSHLVEGSSSTGPGRETSEAEIAALLDRSATQTTVSAAIGMALEQRDFVAVRVVTVWLDLADELGREPSSREVATKANTSHTTVNKALARLRELIQRTGESQNL
jgi:DNA-directed RNA polymerase specialized sigma24 family protein